MAEDVTKPNPEPAKEDRPEVKKVTPDTGVKMVKKQRKLKSWILLAIIDFAVLLSSLYLIYLVPKTANELNRAKSEEQKVIESKNVDITGLEYVPTKESVDKLRSFFPEEAGYIDFIELIEDMKVRGVIKNFSLLGTSAVKDKTGAFGTPVVIEFEGSWEQINTSLKEVQKLPYLIRAVDVEIVVVEEGLINFKYGGFLYVSDKLAKVR